MKKLLLSVIVGISFLGTSRSFAAGEGLGRMVPAGIFAAQLARENNLALGQQEEVRKMLEAEANRDGELPENVARDVFDDWQGQAGASGQGEGKEEGEQEAQKGEKMPRGKSGGSAEAEEKEGESVPPLHMPASIDVLTKYAPGKYQELPPEVIANIDSFMPFVPREWNIQFAPGQVIKQFAQIKNVPFSRSSVYSLAASADGRYAGVAYSNIILIWDMEQNSNKPAYTVRIDTVDPEIGLDSLAFGKGGVVGYTGAKKGQAEQEEIGVWKIEEGRELWLKDSEPNQISGFGWLAFSPDGRHLSYAIDGSTVGDLEWVYVWDAVTGKSDEELSKLDMKTWRNGGTPLFSGLQTTTRGTAFSFDGEKQAEVFASGIKIKQLSNGSTKFTEIELYEPFFGPKPYSRVALSPDGSKVGMIKEAEDGFEVQIFDANREVLETVSSVKAPNKKVIGITFSPKGRYLMWAIFDKASLSIAMYVLDLKGYEQQKQIQRESDPSQWTSY